jgi:hypothetical protein
MEHRGSLFRIDLKVMSMSMRFDYLFATVNMLPQGQMPSFSLLRNERKLIVLYILIFNFKTGHVQFLTEV